MYPLDPAYQAQVDDLIQQIQNSDELAAFLESEEEGDYAALRETFEPAVAELYREVAIHAPLQLLSLETVLLDDRLEGLYLPKILGFTVLRGPVNEHCQYHYPQEAFRKTLLAICASSNFDELRKRIGQTVQIGFALSSHIWVTNLLEEVENRQIRQYLQTQKLERYHDLDQRLDGYRRYAMQFRDEIFFTTEFPDTLPGLRRSFPSLRQFMERRILLRLDNTTLLEPMYQLVNNNELVGSEEHRYLLVIFMNFFDPTTESKAQVGAKFNQLRKKEAEFTDNYFRVLSILHHSKYDIDAACDRRVAALLDPKIKDDITEYYKLVESVHSKGYIHQDAMDEVRAFYGQHQGLSIVNECVRLTIYNYLRKFLENIETNDYPELFEISKVCAAYFQIFDNEHFKLDVKALCMVYVRKLLLVYTDKRGKDYQDIKRFVQTVFVDLGFLTDKEVVELFKSRRKKKTDE
jgi:hypothetical protein